jgi:uncharacterized protein YjbI with pentapeptide repeats
VARSYGVPLHLPGAQLEMANIPHIDLRGANLAGANLRGAMLWGALLDGACLDGADLTCANLTWSSLCGCSMQGTLLVEADLDEAMTDGISSDAVTAGADMVTINLSEESLQESLMRLKAEGFDDKRPRLEVLEEDRRIEARDAAVLARHLQSAPPSLRARGVAGFNSKYEQLKLAKTRVLSDGDLHELLRWSAETGNPLNLRGCNLSGANLRNAQLRGACLACTDATGADIRDADLVGADLQDSCGW